MEVSAVEELQRLADMSRQAFSGFGRDGRLAWHIWGEGRPLVLLHGGYGSWRHWARNIDALGRRYQLWVPDLPSLGASTLAPDGAGLEDIAGFVLQGLRQLEMGSVPAVAGFSFGSIIGGHMASQAPISSLVLVGPSGLGATRASVPLEKIPPHASAPQIAAVHRRNLGSLMISDPGKVDEVAVAIQTANVREARFKSIRFARADALLTALRRTQAGRISAIWGENDAVAKGAIAERISVLETVPQFRGIEVIEGAGHWVMYEAPSEFNAALQRQLGAETP